MRCTRLCRMAAVAAALAAMFAAGCAKIKLHESDSTVTTLEARGPRARIKTEF